MTVALSFNDTLGNTIPPDTQHAISVSLPTWRSNVGYEEGEDWVLSKMQCGYPRFFIHKSIDRLAGALVSAHGFPETEKAMLFPSVRCAGRCREFIKRQNPTANTYCTRILEFVTDTSKLPSSEIAGQVLPYICAVFYPKDLWPTAKAFWQHTGEGTTSRRAEFCHRALDDGLLVEKTSLENAPSRMAKGPRRYQRHVSTDNTNLNGAGTEKGDAAAQSSPVTSGIIDFDESTVKGAGAADSAQFIEERFGRNLNATLGIQAKLAIRRRIAGSLTAAGKDKDLPDSLNEPADETQQRRRDLPEFSEDDVYIFPMGMNAIYTAHRILLLLRGPLKSIMFGFPYVDTLKVLEKFGPGALFYGHGSAADLDDLESRLQNGERFLSLFCEFPGNPLLRSPDLQRLRHLADTYDFALVVDETIGNFLNVHLLPHVDIVVSSLSKIFSGDSNVMGGAMILNPRSKWYPGLKTCLATEYEDTQFVEDSVYLERNSRDFVARIRRVDGNAERIADLLHTSPKTKQVNYPKYSPTRPFYDAFRNPGGGFGGLLSATFHSVADAELFYDHLNTQKGPSLGTNFTLSSPFVLLAHYGELEWAARYGCELSLIRFSIGLEDPDRLVKVFQAALDAIPDAA